MDLVMVVVMMEAWVPQPEAGCMRDGDGGQHLAVSYDDFNSPFYAASRRDACGSALSRRVCKVILCCESHDPGKTT